MVAAGDVNTTVKSLEDEHYQGYLLVSQAMEEQRMKAKEAALRRLEALTGRSTGVSPAASFNHLPSSQPAAPSPPTRPHPNESGRPTPPGTNGANNKAPQPTITDANSSTAGISPAFLELLARADANTGPMKAPPPVGNDDDDDEDSSKADVMKGLAQFYGGSNNGPGNVPGATNYPPREATESSRVSRSKAEPSQPMLPPLTGSSDNAFSHIRSQYNTADAPGKLNMSNTPPAPAMSPPPNQQGQFRRKSLEQSASPTLGSRAAASSGTSPAMPPVPRAGWNQPAQPGGNNSDSEDSTEGGPQPSRDQLLMKLKQMYK